MERSTTGSASESQTCAVLIAEIIERLKKEYGDQLVSVLLYGSFARGTATDGSDIDIILVIEDRGHGHMWEHDRFVSFNLRFKNESKLYINRGTIHTGRRFSSVRLSSRARKPNRTIFYSLTCTRKGKYCLTKMGSLPGVWLNSESGLRNSVPAGRHVKTEHGTGN